MIPLSFADRASAAGTFLFDGTKAESAANADWVIDADKHDLSWSRGPAVLNGGNESDPQRVPTPAASGINAYTSGTYWNGAFSSFGVGVVQQGFGAESLPYNGSITYGNSSNPQDLSHYSAFVLSEPNILFTSAEKTAILSYVQNGGGLIIVTDHSGSDRNNDGKDSVSVVNDLLQNNSVKANAFGVTDNANDISPYSTDINSSARNPLTQGPAAVLNHLTYHDGSTFTIDPSVNPTVTAAAWSGATPSNSTAMAVYGQFGSGHFVLLGDTSPVDDGSGDPNDTSIIDGWDSDGGMQLMLNAANFVSPGNIHWYAGDGNWNTPSNWFENTVPAAGNDVRFITNNSTSPTLTYDTSNGSALLNSLKVDNLSYGTTTFLIAGNYALNATTEAIGVDGTAIFDQRAGTNNAGILTLGANTYGNGQYKLGGTGALSVGTTLIVGGAGHATFVQSGGTLTVGSTAVFSIGDGSGSTGLYTMTGGVIASGANEVVGNFGTGGFEQDGGVNSIGTQSAPRSLVLGNTAGSNGTYSLNSPATLNAGSEVVGNAASGFFEQDGGIHTIGYANLPGNLTLGALSSSYGQYLFNGGRLSVGGNESVSVLGGAAFTQNGGLHIVGAAASGPFTLSIGAGIGAGGTYLLAGGTLTVSNAEVVGGSGGIGSFTQSSGVHTVGTSTVSGSLSIGTGTAGTGNYSLSNDGSLTVYGNVLVGAALAQKGVGTLAIYGGSLSATGSLSVGPSSQLILSGGSLAVGTLNLAGGSTSFNWSAGTLELTQSPLIVGTAGFLGATPTISASQSLVIDQSVTINSGATLGVSGSDTGTTLFRAGLLNNQGTLSLDTTTATIGTTPLATALSGTGTFSLQNANLKVLGLATISGAVIADASSLTFNSGITVDSTGNLQLGNQSQWVVAGGNFANNTTSAANSVSGANLAFLGTGNQTLSLGTSQAANLLWGSVEIGAGTTLTINGGKLLVNDLILDGTTVPDLSNIVVQNSNTINAPQSISVDTSTPSNRVTFFTSTTGGFTFSNGATYTNAGSFDNETDQSFSGDGTFYNTGTFRKQASIGVTAFSIPLNNDGLIDVRSGTLSLQNGGTGIGSASVSSGAALEIASVGTATFTNGDLVNNGTLNIVKSAATFGAISGIGTTNITGTSVASASLTASRLAQTGLHIDTATLSVAGDSTVTNFTANQATLNGASPDDDTFNQGITNLTVTGTFQEQGNTTLGKGLALNLAGPGVLSSNSIDGGSNTSIHILAGSTVQHDDAGALTIGKPVVSVGGTFNANHGTVTIQNGGDHTGVLNVASGATLNVGGDFESSAFVNAHGSIGLSSSAGDSGFYGPSILYGHRFSGTLNVDPGVAVKFDTFGQPAGDIQFDNGSTVSFGAGVTLTSSADSTVIFQNQQSLAVGAATFNGNVIFQNPTLTIDTLTVSGGDSTAVSFQTYSGTNIGMLNQSAGTLDTGGYAPTPLNVGTFALSGGHEQGVVQVNNQMTWTGGVIDGSNSRLTVASGATLSISGAGGTINGSGGLTNAGVTTATGNVILGSANGSYVTTLEASGGTLTIAGTLGAGNDGTTDGGSTFGYSYVNVDGGQLTAKAILLGNSLGTYGVLNLSSGTVTVGDGGIAGYVSVDGGRLTVVDQDASGGSDPELNRSITAGYQVNSSIYVRDGIVTAPLMKLGVTTANSGSLYQSGGMISVSTMGIGNDANLAAGAGIGTADIAGGVLSATTILIGSSTGGSGALIAEYSGTINADSIICGGSASANSASISISSGGVVNVGTLDATSAEQLTFGAGTVSINSGALYTPLTGLTIGDGVSTAVLQLRNSTVHGALAFAAGAELTGTGGLLSSVSVAGAGVVSPGGATSAGTSTSPSSSVGKLTFAAGLSLSTDSGGNSLLQIELGSPSTPGTTFDQIVISGGTFTVGGSTLQLLPLAGLQFNTPYAIVVATGGIIDYSAAFSNLTNGMGNDNGLKYQVSYSPGEIDVTVTGVPEPTTLVPIAAGLGFLLRRRRNKA